MRNYDFKSLSDKDLEILVCDLLSAEHNVRYERFKQGKDGGVDGRYFSPKGEQIILQCKHWSRSSVPALIRSLKSTELPKVAKLNPQRYLLVTTLELSPANKGDIKAALSPFVISDSDVFGKEDINDLIGRHQNIERQHYKLWLSGTNVLNTILHSAILGRSDFVVEDILEKSSKYVTTKVHAEAEMKLSEQRVVIIAGEAGVGKTTLAEQLCLQYVTDGFQLVVIGNSIEEAEAVYAKDKPQVFYFDDFLGRNYLFALNRHEDTHIVSFIRRVSGDKSKRFVLTSRTNVLNQGKSLSDTFYIAKIDRAELEVRISALSPYEKAEILYNHVWFSELEINYVEEILRDRRYRTIINHKNFNPRLISFITDPYRLTQVAAGEYWNYIQDKLNNPADVWAHTYESQLDDFSRAIVLIVVLNGGFIEEEDLRSAYYRMLEDPIAVGYSGKSDFNLNIRTLTGSLLNRNQEGHFERITLTLFNPSVADYVINRIKEDARLIEAIMLATASIRGANNLSALATGLIVSHSIVQRSFISLVERYLLKPSSWLTAHYKLTLVENGFHFLRDDMNFIKLVMSFIKTVSTEDSSDVLNSGLFGEVLRPLLMEKIISDVDAWNILVHIKLDELDHSQFEALTPLCQYLSGKIKQEFTDNLRQAILTFWGEFITQEIVDRGILGGFYELDDRLAAEEVASTDIRELLRGYGLPFTEAEVRSIVNECDIVQIMEDNIVREAKDSYEDYREHRMGGADDGIDDLFVVDMPTK